MMAVQAMGGGPPVGEATTPEAASGPCVANLAIDADYEFFQRHGNDVNTANNVANHIQTIINTVNLQYEQDVAITHQVTTIIVRIPPHPTRTRHPTPPRC